MKIENTKSVILRPLLLGLLGLAVGGGLFVYYYFFKEDTSVAAYVINGAIALVGFLGIVATIYFAIEQYLKIKTKKEGQIVKAQYVSHYSNVSSGKINYYKVPYKYEIDGVSQEKTSKSEFIWKEVLTLKAVDNFQIRVLNGRVVLDCDLDKMFEDNKQAVLELEERYNKAREEVAKIVSKN